MVSVPSGQLTFEVRKQAFSWFNRQRYSSFARNRNIKRMGYLVTNSLLTVFKRWKTEKVELSLISDITLTIRIEKVHLTLFFHSWLAG